MCKQCDLEYERLERLLGGLAEQRDNLDELKRKINENQRTATCIVDLVTQLVNEITVNAYFQANSP